MTNGNDPAFVRKPATEYPNTVSGLTKREYFAAMAMQGILASAKHDAFTNTEKETGKPAEDALATACVEMADAIIKALNNDTDTTNP